MTDDLIARIRDACERSGSESSDYDLNPEVSLPEGRKLRDAGVLIPIRVTPDGNSVVLTKRSSALKHHPGQIAFPGGKKDKTDADVVAAALREAHEEIGLLPEQVEVLGQLSVHETVTAFRVTPVIGLVHGTFHPIPEAGEVDEVFDVPMPFLMDASNYRVQNRRWRGQQRAYFTVPYGPYYIWGATARMLRAWSDLMR